MSPTGVLWFVLQLDLLHAKRLGFGSWVYKLAFIGEVWASGKLSRKLIVNPPTRNPTELPVLSKEY